MPWMTSGKQSASHQARRLLHDLQDGQPDRYFTRKRGGATRKTPLAELLPRSKHPIVCANCHEPATMNLRVVNPAFIEAMAATGVST